MTFIHLHPLPVNEQTYVSITVGIKNGKFDYNDIRFQDETWTIICSDLNKRTFEKYYSPDSTHSEYVNGNILGRVTLPLKIDENTYSYAQIQAYNTIESPPTQVNTSYIDLQNQLLEIKSNHK